MPADPVKALAEALAPDLELERPSEAAHGDYATNAALKLAGARRRPPREIAQELAAQAEALAPVERAEIAGPGFVNLFLRDAWFVDALGTVLADETWPRSGMRVQIEMVSANPTGPLHVAHGRNGAYGDSVARLLEFCGHAVEREYYYNDSGGQMDRFRASVEALRRGEAPPEDGYHGSYIRELADDPGDPVPAMLQRIEQTLERFRIHFDTWERQSVVERRLPELLPKLDTYERDGALWARSSAYGDDEDRVLLRSGDRSPTYRAADVPYLVEKLERGYDRAIYVLGADHHGTRNWYASVARMLGYDPARVEVLLYQLVHLTKGGEATRMSKRRGDVVFLDDFLDEIGVDAARWYLVSRGPDQTIEIDVDLAAERSQKNPVYYVQYAHARIAGILRNAGAAEGTALQLAEPLAAEERELVKRLVEFPAVVAEAAERRGPQGIPAYAIRVADDFHRFYHEHRVLESEQEAFRLALCRATQLVIARCLHLVGVDAPERM
ncbi:MAG: arginine--tRNA ligase [Acidobacteriota bacterium]|nr:arginine--tRNA ligase [Acidobacteriota bacterium]